MLPQSKPSRLGRFKLVFALLLTTTTIAIASVARPVFHLGWTAWHDRQAQFPVTPGSVDDATHVAQQHRATARSHGNREFLLHRYGLGAG